MKLSVFHSIDLNRFSEEIIIAIAVQEEPSHAPRPCFAGHAQQLNRYVRSSFSRKWKGCHERVNTVKAVLQIQVRSVALKCAKPFGEYPVTGLIKSSCLWGTGCSSYTWSLILHKEACRQQLQPMVNVTCTAVWQHADSWDRSHVAGFCTAHLQQTISAQTSFVSSCFCCSRRCFWSLCGVCVNSGFGCSVSKCAHVMQFLEGWRGGRGCHVPFAFVLWERNTSVFWVCHPTLVWKSFWAGKCYYSANSIARPSSQWSPYQCGETWTSFLPVSKEHQWAHPFRLSKCPWSFFHHKIGHSPLKNEGNLNCSFLRTCMFKKNKAMTRAVSGHGLGMCNSSGRWCLARWLISTGDMWDVGLSPPCPGAHSSSCCAWPRELQTSFRKVCRSSEGLHLQEGLRTEML